MKKILFGAMFFATMMMIPFAAQAKDYPAGPIWNNADAQKKCPVVCARHKATWNGQWRTTVINKMSVCGCVVKKPCGPYQCWWMNPRIGNKWVTTASALGRAYSFQQCYNANSCGCGGKRSGGGCYKWARCVDGKGKDFCKHGPVAAPKCHDVNAGPIWNNADAQKKCPAVCARQRTRWNGQWRTTVTNRMSVCGCCR